jgi:hypothetical protein
MFGSTTSDKQDRRGRFCSLAMTVVLIDAEWVIASDSEAISMFGSTTSDKQDRCGRFCALAMTVVLIDAEWVS